MRFRIQNANIKAWILAEIKTERQGEAGLGPHSWSAHRIFAVDEGFGYVTVALSWQDV
jgi:hypothetical protein